MAPEARRSRWSVVIGWVLVASVMLAVTTAEPASTAAPSSTKAPTSSPQPKEKRSQEDIMFGNQQNKPASGMVDDFFQSAEAAPNKNSTPKASSESQEGAASSSGEGTGSSEHRQTLAEMPDRLDYYDYVQPESTDGQGPAGGPPSVPVAEEDDLEDEDAERNSFFLPQEPPSFGSQKLVSSAKLERNELGDYASPEEEYGPSRRKRGAFHRLRSPLEDLLSPSGVPFRRRRASMRLKRDAASNELLNWLALLHRSQSNVGARRGNQEEVAFQEFQGLEPEPLELTDDTGYLYEPLAAAAAEEDLGEEEGVPSSVLDSLPLPEEGPDGDALDWEVPVRAPPRRRSSFYPVDYRYLLLPGARKRSGLLTAPGGHFGAMREVSSRWPGEPQSGRWGHFPLLHQPGVRLGLPVAVRRAPAQESDAERLYALASLLAAPGVSSRDLAEAEPDQDRRRRRRSPRPAPLKG